MAEMNGTGQGGKNFQDRELAARVRTLALSEIERALKKKKGKLYEAVLIKLAGTVLPKLTELSGPDGRELPVPIFQVIASKDVQSHDSDEEDHKAE